MTELFQTSLFGYSKKSVHTYISEMNEDFSRKLLEKDGTCKETIQALREAFHAVLRGMDEEMEQYGIKCQAIQTEFAQSTQDDVAGMEASEKKDETLA